MVRIKYRFLVVRATWAGDEERARLRAALAAVKSGPPIGIGQLGRGKGKASSARGAGKGKGAGRGAGAGAGRDERDPAAEPRALVTCSAAHVSNAVKLSVLAKFSAAGAAALSQTLQVRYYCRVTRLAIVRGGREHLGMLREAVAAVRVVNDHAVTLDVVETNGSVRTVAKAVARWVRRIGGEQRLRKTAIAKALRDVAMAVS